MGGGGSGISGLLDPLNITGMADTMSSDKSNEESDEAYLKSERNQMYGYGTTDLTAAHDILSKGTLTPAEEMRQELNVQSQQAGTEQFLSRSGLSDSSLGTSMRGSISQQDVIARGEMSRADAQMYFNMALKEIGISDVASANLLTQHNQMRQENQAAYMALFSAVGSIFGANTNYQPPQSGGSYQTDNTGELKSLDTGGGQYMDNTGSTQVSGSGSSYMDETGTPYVRETQTYDTGTPTSFNQ